ncbi:GNAT family N-acetyltransferase [Chitinibacter fontanus]|uniref:GNAT family N-acetyltransferase n=1 Tax=Chitinibacter fontanus TaxID=1737446 RepID=A0A7D5ZCG9_9NEIS|nr:GNAT family N-acetyltransferase [Chitinibacter fontanus]QLI80664.1 GNAT family N-acetyltransferase [Chitinibacter fontanus]
MVHVRYATLDDLATVVPLFQAYRAHFGKPSDPAAEYQFVRERMLLRQSVILLAETETGHALGFSQLYPMFGSLNMVNSLLLNDLFVAETARGMGVGRALLCKAQQHAKAVGAVRLNLFTGVDNQQAQTLYEACGFQRDTAHYGYYLPLS